MVLIHAGFLAYEMGASRSKNALASGIKNILAFAMIVPFFYFVGWWIYWAFPTGLTLSAGAMGISGLAYANDIALPWSQYMGPNLDDRASGVFWGAFVLFAATTASILSGGVIERIKLTGFVVLAIVLGAFVWILAGAWGWHADGWLVTKLGYHDFGAAGVVHMVAGFFTLGVLINLGPRIGKFNADGTANHIAGHSMPMTLIGLMLIIAGFWGFLMGCVIVPGEAWSWSSSIETTIYGTPMTISGMTFNTLMGFAGGIIAAQGYPAMFGEEVIETSLIGQLIGAGVMGLLGFVPGYVVSLILKLTGQLRVPTEAEIAGLDSVKVPADAYPESLHPSVSPAE